MGRYVWLTPTRAGGWSHEHTPGGTNGFSSLGSIQVTILHFPVMGKVHCEYQSQTFALMSLTWVPLQLAQSTVPDQLDSEEEFWANTMLFTWPTSDYTVLRLLVPWKWPKMCCEFFQFYDQCKYTWLGFPDYWTIWCYSTHACSSSLSLGSFCLHPSCSCQFLLVNQTQLLYDNQGMSCPHGWFVLNQPSSLGVVS